MQAPLFRRAVVEQQGERLWGRVLVTQPLAPRLVTGLLALLVLVVAGFLLSHSYPRRVTVTGALAPVGGVVEVVAPASGVLERLSLPAGRLVQRGAPLFEIAAERALVAGAPLAEQRQQAWQQQWQSLEAQQALETARQQQRDQHYTAERQRLTLRRDALQQLQEQQRGISGLRVRQAERGERLWQQGLLAAADRESLSLLLLEQQQAEVHSRLELQSVEAELAAVEREQRLAGLDAAGQFARWRSEGSALRQQRLQQQAAEVFAVSAPLAGLLGSLHVQRGMSVQAGQPVLSLLPAQAPLQVELWLPSSALGFVAVGQHVTLRLDAFPYQKFGVQQARLTEVSVTAEQGAEGQWLHRAFAALDRQSVLAFGVEQALRPGMLVSADIELERRSLLEWVLEPLFSLRGRW